MTRPLSRAPEHYLMDAKKILVCAERVREDYKRPEAERQEIVSCLMRAVTLLTNGSRSMAPRQDLDEDYLGSNPLRPHPEPDDEESGPTLTRKKKDSMRVRVSAPNSVRVSRRKIVR